jgi:hypothetical protein
VKAKAQPSGTLTGSRDGRPVRLWVALPAAVVAGGLLAATGLLDTARAEVLLAVALALLVVAGLVLGFYGCQVPDGWLLHVTSREAAAATAAGQPPGHVHLLASGGLARVAPLFGAANPWRRRVYFFSTGPRTRWQRFNLPPPKRCVAIWVRTEDLAALIGTDVYRRALDGGVAWAAYGYVGPAVIEEVQLGTASAKFGPRTIGR